MGVARLVGAVLVSTRRSYRNGELGTVVVSLPLGCNEEGKAESNNKKDNNASSASLFGFEAPHARDSNGRTTYRARIECVVECENPSRSFGYLAPCAYEQYCTKRHGSKDTVRETFPIPSKTSSSPRAQPRAVVPRTGSARFNLTPPFATVAAIAASLLSVQT
jgi:hypothetical protein